MHVRNSLYALALGLTMVAGVATAAFAQSTTTSTTASTTVTSGSVTTTATTASTGIATTTVATNAPTTTSAAMTSGTGTSSGTLPQTGGFPPEAVAGLAAGLTSLGFAARKLGKRS